MMVVVAAVVIVVGGPRGDDEGDSVGDELMIEGYDARNDSSRR